MGNALGEVLLKDELFLCKCSPFVVHRLDLRVAIVNEPDLALGTRWETSMVSPGVVLVRSTGHDLVHFGTLGVIETGVVAAFVNDGEGNPLLGHEALKDDTLE